MNPKSGNFDFIAECERLEKLNAEMLEALKAAMPYVRGAYECAFPDQEENDEVLEMVNDAIRKAEGQ
jgi:hypothetical protein